MAVISFTADVAVKRSQRRCDHFVDRGRTLRYGRSPNHLAATMEKIVRDTKGRRVRALRRAVAPGMNQTQFAKMIGIPMKVWNGYEHGNPVPREPAWLLMEKIEGFSVDWLWCGLTGNLSVSLWKRLQAAELELDD